MTRIPLLKLFLVGLCTMTLGIYGYFLILSVLSSPGNGVERSANTIFTDKWVQVAEPDLKLREEPSSNSVVINRYGFGQRLQLVAEAGNWFEITDAAGQIGWVQREKVVFTPPGLQ